MFYGQIYPTFFTILHFRKQCPPFSLRRQQTGHRVSMSMPLREILVCNGRLLWANLHRNCFIFGWHVSPQILLDLKDVPVTSVLLDSPFCIFFFISLLSARTWYTDFTEKRPFYLLTLGSAESWTTSVTNKLGRGSSQIYGWPGSQPRPNQASS